MTSNIATTETILPPISAQTTEMVTALIARTANGTEERATLKIGRGTVAINRTPEGRLFLHMYDGYAGSCMASNADEARSFASALTAYADALDPPVSA